MKHFAPILLLGVNASPNNSDLLTNLFLANESKYLHLLGMDSDSGFSQHGSNAVRDVENAYLSLAQESDYEKPTYDVTRDRFVPHADRKKKGRPKKSNLDELKRNLENQYRETRDKWKVSDISDSSDLPVYNVAHDEFG